MHCDCLNKFVPNGLVLSVSLNQWQCVGGSGTKDHANYVEHSYLELRPAME